MRAFKNASSVFIREVQNDIVGGAQRFSILKNQVSRHKVKENPCKLLKYFITGLVRN